jgi:hypothetical protein
MQRLTIFLLFILTFIYPAIAIGQKTESSDFFEEDSRLKIKVNENRLRVSYLTLLKKLTKETTAPLHFTEASSEFKTQSLAIGCNKSSAFELMDAIAALYLLQWDTDGKKGYRLLPPQNEQDFVLKPQDDFERERFEASEAFLNHLKDAPKPLRAMIASGAFLPIKELPKNLRDDVEDMITALNKTKIKRGGTVWNMNQLPNALIGLINNPKENYTNYEFTITIPGIRATGFRYNDYMQRRAEAVRAKSGTGVVYNTLSNCIKREEAVQSPYLKRRVSISIQNGTLPEVLKALHEKYDIPFVSQANDGLPERTSIKLTNMPLADALDMLKKNYKDTDWEYRKTGYILFWGKTNLARNPLKNHQYSFPADPNSGIMLRRP